MKRYDEKLLHQLLDKYESSKVYLGQAKRKQKIAVSIQKSSLPEYFDLSSAAYEVIHEQLQALEDRGYVELVWKDGKRGHILSGCVLKLERLEDCYAWLHRQPKRQQEQTVWEILKLYRDRNPVMSHFCEFVEERIEQGKSIKKYLNREKPEELERLCRLVCAILENREEIYLREFSVRHFQDSKYVEGTVGKAAEIIERFSGEEVSEQLEQSPEELLEEYGIYKNPSWIMLKGCGCFYLRSGSVVDIRQWQDGLGIPSSELPTVKWKQGEVKRVLTIENLTTFHRVKKEGTLILYLGGYANPVKREFLKKLYQTFPEAVYEHFGDIDCGGFRIWRSLREKTGIPFQTVRMDLDTFQSYQSYGRPLTKSDRKELLRMSDDPYYEHQWELFREMLREDRKLEQECLSVTARPSSDPVR